jgi:hypothetical protein
MPRITLRPSFTKDLDGLKRASRKDYQRACEILTEIQPDVEPSASRRAETRLKWRDQEGNEQSKLLRRDRRHATGFGRRDYPRVLVGAWVWSRHDR